MEKSGKEGIEKEKRKYLKSVPFILFRLVGRLLLLFVCVCVCTLYYTSLYIFFIQDLISFLRKPCSTRQAEEKATRE